MAIFTISRTLGPKIIIVKRMVRSLQTNKQQQWTVCFTDVKVCPCVLCVMCFFSFSYLWTLSLCVLQMMDMFFFMFLLSIWVVAYGVAKQGILIDNDNRLDWIIRGAVYEPYLIIFGNFPTNIDSEWSWRSNRMCLVSLLQCLMPFCVSFISFRCGLHHRQLQHEWHRSSEAQVSHAEWEPNTSLPWVAHHHHALCLLALRQHTAAQPAHSDLQVSSPHQEFPVPFVFCFPTVIVCLSPSVFVYLRSFTFQEVQDNTDRIWKFQRYELIKEYHSRPTAPPPFIILSHLYLFTRSTVLRIPFICKEFSKDSLINLCIN